MKNANPHKFQFDLEFQSEILHYTIREPLGYRMFALFDESYFESLSHSLIAYALRTYFRKHKKIPSRPVIKEHIRKLYSTKREFSDLDNEIKDEVTELINYYYKEPVKDPEEIFTSTRDFKQYTELTHIVERADLTDFENYRKFADKIQKAINIGENATNNDGIFIYKEFLERQQRRRQNPDVVPLPYWQMNHLTNAGGYPRGSLITIIGKGKRFKTAALVNIAAGYTRMRKKVAYIDLENNEDPLAMRFEQGIAKISKRELLSFKHDRKISKTFRRYIRVGAEVVVKRFPAYVTTADDVQSWIDMMRLKHNMIFDSMIVDYIGLAGAISKKNDDTERISDAYVDFKNLAKFNNFDTIFTAHHITREGHKRIGTKFEPTDTAKCLDIHRHVDAMWGIQESDEERDNGVSRWEVVDQRDGVPEGNALFFIDADLQLFTEFTRKQKQEYIGQLNESRDENPKSRREPDDDA